MNNNSATTVVSVLLAGVGGAVLAGCGGASPSPRSGMMGGQEAGPGYHYSRLVCSGPTSPPGRVVTVRLADMGMTQMMGGTAPLGAHMMLRAFPATVTAGKITFVAQNMGWRTHELVVLPLKTNTQAGLRVPNPDGKVDESGNLGESSASCAAGSGEGITAGAVGWTTLTLPPGRYELICNLTNHYANGMRQELDVTSG
jgi:uncharacterized cupredoxin-like copper-binding protein